MIFRKENYEAKNFKNKEKWSELENLKKYLLFLEKSSGYHFNSYFIVLCAFPCDIIM